MKAFFPTAERYRVETRILSGVRTELAQSLRRTPTGDENALHLYRVYKDTNFLGTVATRRIKGEYGAIEIVLATDTTGRVRGIRLQRMREPEPIASALESPPWRRSFEGKTSQNAWQLGQDMPDVPDEARASAQAVLDGTRSLLILLAAADNAQSRTLVASPHH